MAGLRSTTQSGDRKQSGSYFDLFVERLRYIGAYAIEAGKLFELFVFNYLVGNGDAHFRNFSLIEARGGGYVLAPAYDLLCTGMHVEDTPFALSQGLLPAAGCSGSIGQQFRALADQVGLPLGPAERIFSRVPGYTEAVEALAAR